MEHPLDEHLELRARLRAVEERIERVAGRLVMGYGSDSDRDGWRRWLDQLTAQRDELRRALGEAGGPVDRGEA